ncbi:Uncharacterised protein, partial [Mycoplasmoides gallisepticum]
MARLKQLFLLLKNDKKVLALTMILTSFKSIFRIGSSLIFGYVIQNIFVNITTLDPVVAQENW